MLTKQQVRQIIGRAVSDTLSDNQIQHAIDNAWDDDDLLTECYYMHEQYVKQELDMARACATCDDFIEE